MNLKYSAVIVTYNRLNLLKECIVHVLNQNYPVSEIIVVNNASSDGTKEYLKKYITTDMFKIINLEKNIGGAGGFYEGVKNVSSDIDYMLLIDDDAMITPDYLKNISEQMEDNVLAYSGTVETNGKIHTMHRRRLKGKTLLKRSRVSESEYNEHFFYYDISTFCGLVVANSLVGKIGLPEKDYFIWNDDFEYSLRIIDYTRIKNVNNAILDHKTVILENEQLCWKDYYSQRNLIDLGRKHSKHPSVFLTYRYTVFIVRMLYCTLRYVLAKKDKVYWKNCVLLRKQVLIDSFHKKLGVSDVFYPGRNMYDSI